MNRHFIFMSLQLWRAVGWAKTLVVRAIMQFFPPMKIAGYLIFLAIKISFFATSCSFLCLEYFKDMIFGYSVKVNFRVAPLYPLS